MSQLILVDYASLGIIALSVVIGIWRGFLREFISLATWVAAFVIAYVFSAQAAVFLAPYISVPSVRAILAFGGLFLITLFLGGLVNLLVAQVIKHTGLSGTDRLVGLIFGALRGAVLVGLLLMAAKLTPLPEDPWWQRSVTIPYFEPLADWMYDQIPPEFVCYIDAQGCASASTPSGSNLPPKYSIQPATTPAEN